MKKNLDFFLYLNNIYNKKLGIPPVEEVKDVVWIINRFLSMEVALLDTIAYLSRYLYILGSQYYILLYRVVPFSNSSRNKYLKVEKFEELELLDRYVEYFKLSRREVKQYLKVLLTLYTKKEVYEYVGLEEPKEWKESADGKKVF